MKHALKKLRVLQPFNYMATSTVHVLMCATGWKSEFIIKHLHRAGTVRCKLPNGRTLRLWSRADDWVSNQIYWRGWTGYEPETTPLFFRAAQQARVTLDVGAYVGFYTLLAGHANPAGQVYAFEPLPQPFERLLYNVSLNRLSNVRCINGAAGEFDGTAELFYAGTPMPTNSSLSAGFLQATAQVHALRVPLVCLDSFVQANGIDRVDLVKVDTESTEPSVLRGMIQTVRRCHPMIICEVLSGCGNETPLEQILRPLGYHYYLLTPDGPVWREFIEGHPQWLNYLFTTHPPEMMAGVQ